MPGKNTKQIEGLPTLRPSVEAGFHSILRKFVCHTHSVYANFACCSTACREIAEKAFAGADYSWGWVPYTDPGANLTFAIRRELARVEHATGRVPAVILMQNHGIIVHSDSADECLRINADANGRLAAQFGKAGDSFPKVAVKPIADGLYEVDAPALTEALQSGRYDYRTLIESPLYPDQMVFLIGTLFENKPELAEGRGLRRVQDRQSPAADEGEKRTGRRGDADGGHVHHGYDPRKRLYRVHNGRSGKALHRQLGKRKIQKVSRRKGIGIQTCFPQARFVHAG